MALSSPTVLTYDSAASSGAGLPVPLNRPVLVAGAARLGHLLAASNLTELQGALAPPQLQQETQLYERLLYKNKNQHRHARYFQRCVEVKRHLRLLHKLQLPALLAHLQAGTKESQGSQTKPSTVVPAGAAWLPQRDLGFLALRRLRGGALEAAAVAAAAAKAARKLGATAAQGFFLPFCLTMTAVLARLHIYAAQMVLDCVRGYNAVAELVPVLPAAAAEAKQPAGAAAHSPYAAMALRPEQLPPMLACDWREGLPCVRSMDMETGESWATRCAAAWKTHGLSLAAQAPAAHPQPRPSAAQQPAAGTAFSFGVAAGDELGVRLDRRQFAAARATMLQLHAVRDVLPAPQEAAQPIRFERAAAPLGLGSAPADGAAATIAAPVATTAAAMEWASPATAVPVTQAAAPAQAAGRSGGISQQAPPQPKQPPEALAAMLALQQPPQPQRRRMPNATLADAQQPAAQPAQQAAPLTSEQPPLGGPAGPQPMASVAAAPAPSPATTVPGNVPQHPRTIAPAPEFAAAPTPAPEVSSGSMLGLAAGGSWGSAWAAAPGLGSEPAASLPVSQQPSPAAPAAAPWAAQQPAGAEIHGSSAPEGAMATADDTAAPMQVDAVPQPAAEPQRVQQQDAQEPLPQPPARRTLLQPQRKKRRAATAVAAAQPAAAVRSSWADLLEDPPAVPAGGMMTAARRQRASQPHAAEQPEVPLASSPLQQPVVCEAAAAEDAHGQQDGSETLAVSAAPAVQTHRRDIASVLDILMPSK